jgi:glycosyltransferase involved in cell wall biosynthesis
MELTQSSLDQYLISVVIPAYNRANLMETVLRSVQLQTHKNWEAIIVDDGSVDKTSEVVGQLASKDPKVRYIRQPQNRGAQAARNAGIRAARGEWISFLDSDDHFLPHSLAVRLQTALAQKLSVVHSECNYVEEDGAVKPYGIPAIVGRAYERLLRGPAPLLQGLLVSKNALTRIGYLDESIVAFQEWDTFIRLAKHYEFGFVKEPTFLYDCRHSDSMSKNDLLGARGYEQVFHKHFTAILRLTGPSSLASHYHTAATWYRRGGDLAAARRCELKAGVWSSLNPRVAARRLVRAVRL